MSRMALELTVNGEQYSLFVEPHWSLLQALREGLGLIGTKENCLEAECGVCTVLLDGRAVCSCITMALQCEHKAITTIEGLSTNGTLHPLQDAFIRHNAVQCGYCIPGMILTAKSFLDANPGIRPNDDEIREAIAGTLCRCTGYQKIVDAVADAANVMAGDQT